MVLREGLCVVVVLLMTQVLTEDVDCSLGDSTSSCKICINGTRSGKCAWCKETGTCLPYNPVTDITNLPNCGKNFYASNCVVNHKMVIVGVGIAAGLVILFVTGCTIWCCCCRGRKARAKKMKKQEDEYQAQRDAISDKHEAGRADRQEKTDAIRMKYGLKKNNAYERFD